MNSFYLIYLSSTFAPAASSFALISSASFLFTPDLTSFGAPSTRSLASFKPNEVAALTSLITLIFLSPAETSMIEKSSLSSAAAAAPAAAAASDDAAPAAEEAEEEEEEAGGFEGLGSLFG